MKQQQQQQQQREGRKIYLSTELLQSFINVLATFVGFNNNLKDSALIAIKSIVERSRYDLNSETLLSSNSLLRSLLS